MLRALQISQQYPCDAYPALGVMVHNALLALAPGCALEVLSPRPYTLPLPGFPYGQLARLPTRRREHGLLVHRPRYAYLVPKPLFYPWAGPAMARSCLHYARRLTRPDIVHAHWAYPDGWAGVALCAHFGCPLVVHARGTLERVVAKQSARMRARIAAPLRAAAAVVANSDALRADCLALGVPAHKLHVIPNGVDLVRFGPADKAAAKRRLGLPLGRRWVLYCGNLRPVKGVDLLARAIPSVLQRCPELGFVLVGGGELETRLRRELRAELRAGSVVMTGALAQQQVAAYMQAADLLVLPSRSEARGNVVLEALACETPVAGAAVGGIPELVRPEHGVLFAPADVQALSDTLVDLGSDPARLAQLGAAGRRFAQGEQFSWGRHATRTLELYDRLVAGARGR